MTWSIAVQSVLILLAVLIGYALGVAKVEKKSEGDSS